MIGLNYILFHNLEKNVKEQLIKNYLQDGYQILYQDDNDIILKKGDREILDEETYIQITVSVLKRNRFIKTASGKIVDLSKAFIYAKEKGKYDFLHNHFDWTIRNILLKEFLS